LLVGMGMNYRYVLFLAFFFAASLPVQAQQNDSSPAMSMASGGYALPSEEDYISRLHLYDFQAALKDPSICAQDQDCLKKIKVINTLECIITACGKDAAKESEACVSEKFNDLRLDQKEKISTDICAWVKSPSAATRNNLKNDAEDRLEDENLVLAQAYISAMNGSGDACQQTVKDYMGPYGPKWDRQWYAILSECRILSHQRSVDQEKSDYLAWYKVEQGTGQCAGIINEEMRSACSNADAPSPIAPPHEE